MRRQATPRNWELIIKYVRIIIPGKDEDEMPIHEFSAGIGTPERGNKCKIVPVKDATYAREKCCTSIAEVMVRIAASLNFFQACWDLLLQFAVTIYEIHSGAPRARGRSTIAK